MRREHHRTRERSRTSGETPADQSTEPTIAVLERARTGDRSAALLLIERATPSVRLWARGKLPRSVRSDADTEDIVQDAVLNALRRIPSFQHRTAGGMGAYLRVSVINGIRDLMRASRRRGTVETLTDQLCSAAPSALEATIDRERVDRFLDAVSHLRPADRQLILWRVEMGFSVVEIAAKLGKSKAATGMSVTRAMARVTKELKLAAISS